MFTTGLRLDFEYDKRTKRFRYTSGASKGQYLSRSASLSIVNRNVNRIKSEMIDLVDSLYDRKIDLDIFIIKQADYIKELHLLKGILGSKGIDRLNDSRIKLIEKQIKEQYDGYDRQNGQKFGLKSLIRELQTDDHSRERLKNRISLYHASGNLTERLIERDVKQNDEGLTEARRLLNGDRHCASCVRYSTGLWGNISDIVLPGFSCECSGRCKCTLEYR